MAKYVFLTEREKVHAKFLLKELCEFADSIFLEWLQKQGLAQPSVLMLEQPQAIQHFKTSSILHINLLLTAALSSPENARENTLSFLGDYKVLLDEVERCNNTIFQIMEDCANKLISVQEAERMMRAHAHAFIIKVQALQKEIE